MQAAPGDEGGSVRRCRQHWRFLRCLAPGGTRPPPGGLEADSAWRYVLGQAI